MRLIVVGAGGAARALLRRIGEVWEVTVVDTDRDLLDEIADIWVLTTVLGDGTLPDVLSEAGLSEAAAVAAAHNDDDVNLAVCRWVREP